MKKFRRIFSSPEWWLAIIPLIAYRQIAFFQNTMMWDMTDQVFVWHRFISECFHQHILPLWCPYSRLGYPFFADPQSGLFYPPTWIFTWLFNYSLYTNNLEFIMHVIGAGFGMRYFLRSLDISRFSSCLFGLVYSLSGPFVSNATHIVFIYSLCWLPFILGSYTRLLKTAHSRYAFLMAIFLSLQITGGYIGLSIILLYVLVLIFLYYFFFSSTNQKLPSLIFTHLLLCTTVAMLTAGFIYSVLRGVAYIDRQNGISMDMANSLAFTPYSLLTFIFPDITTNQSIRFGTDVTMRNIYLGIFTLVFIVISGFSLRRLKAVIFLAGIIFLFIALGVHTPLRSWLYAYIPFMNIFRMASIFRFWTCISFIVLAAYAFDEVFVESYPSAIKAAVNIIAITLAIFVLGLLTILIKKHASMDLIKSYSLLSFTKSLEYSNVWSIISMQLLAHIFLLGTAFIIMRYLRSRYRFQKYLFAGLIVLDMFTAVQMNIYATIACSRKLSDIQKHVNDLPKGFPIVSNIPLISYNEWNDSTIAPPLWHNGGFLRKQITFDGYNGYNLRAYNDLADRKDFYKIIERRKFISCDDDSTQVSITKFSPNQIFFIVNNKQEQCINIGQFYFDGWKASADEGNTICSLTKDSLRLMKCNIPAGRHLVNLSFEPVYIKGFFIYTVIIFSTCFVITLLVFRNKATS